MFSLLNRLNLNAKFLVFTSLVLIIIFTLLATLIYYNQKSELVSSSDSRMYSQLEDLTNLLEIEYKYKQETVDKALRIAENGFFAIGAITTSNQNIGFAAINQVTQSKKIVEVNQWSLNEIGLQNNTAVVDTLQRLTNSEVAIFQKIPEGYMRISTTERNESNKRLEGVYIPSTSPIVQSVERGQVFKGRVNFNNDWYITAFQPLRIEGEIRGILYTGAKEKDLGYLRKKFKEKKYYSTGYPFAMNLQGEYIIHPIFEEKVNTDKKFLEYVKKNKRGKFRLRSEEGDAWKWNYFTYYEPFDLIIAATIEEKELLDKPLNSIQNTIIVGFIVAVAICLGGIFVIVTSITRVLNKLVEMLQNIATGKKIEKIDVQQKDEIGQIAVSVNTLIDGFDTYTDFAQKIGAGNLRAEFQPLSNEDELGNALLEMRNNLSQIAEDDQKRTWITEGTAFFADILRNNNDDIQKLSYDIISNLVHYVNANQGGIFLLNDLEEDNIFLEMNACFAYDRQKMLKKKIMIGEGLVGQAFQESDTLNIKELPQDYINITSGLGEANPANVLIVPLTTSGATLGVIELASFLEFEQRQIEFVQRVSESIASTLFAVKNNLQTKKLLKESREIAQQMREQKESEKQNIEELQIAQEETKRNEMELRRVLASTKAQSENLDALINNTDELILSVDKSYNISLFNIAAKKWYQERNGVKLDIGTNLVKLLSVEQYEVQKEHYSRALLGERFFVEEIIGDEHYEYSYNPVQDEQGRPAGVAVFVRDITERKQKEREISRANELMKRQESLTRTAMQELSQTQSLLEIQNSRLKEQNEATINSAISQAEFALDGTILEANVAFCAAFQYNINEIKGKTHSLLVSTEEANSVEYKNFWKNLRAGVSQTGEYKRIDKYGESVWLASSYSPIKNKEGVITSIIEFSFDITAYKLKEQAYQAKIDALQNKNS